MRKLSFRAAPVLFAAAAMAVQAGPARAASFDCGAASGCVEQVICETPQLSRLDSTMSALYFRLQGEASRRGANRLLASQRDWLDSRDACSCNANCLVSHYRSRIRLFQDVLDLQ